MFYESPVVVAVSLDEYITGTAGVSASAEHSWVGTL